jgi:hypothetical protein
VRQDGDCAAPSQAGQRPVCQGALICLPCDRTAQLHPATWCVEIACG